MKPLALTAVILGCLLSMACSPEPAREAHFAIQKQSSGSPAATTNAVTKVSASATATKTTESSAAVTPVEAWDSSTPTALAGATTTLDSGLETGLPTGPETGPETGPNSASPPQPTPGPGPAPSPISSQSPICRQPVEDYTRVEVAGETLNRRTVEMLETAMLIYQGPADLKRVAQGSYTDAVEGSFGTHDGGGAVDLSIRNPASPAERLYDEVPAMIKALRLAGFAAWYRDWDEVYPGSVPHIHAIAVGDAELSEAAQLQIDGPAGYFLGFNGLPVDPPIADGHGGALICEWMEVLGGSHVP